MQRQHRAIAVAAALMLISSACSNTISDNELSVPTVGVTVSVVEYLSEDKVALIGMTVTTSGDDVLESVDVDPASGSRVILTAGFDRPTTAVAGTPAGPPKARESVETVALPAGQPVVFGPDAYGMIIEQTGDLGSKKTIEVTLILKEAGTLRVESPVVAWAGSP